MKIFKNIISYFRMIFVKQKKLDSGNFEIETENKRENTFIDSIKKDKKEYFNKKSILDEINKNPNLIDTLSYSRLVQLNSLYEERINEVKTKINQLS